jgi:hypothetical protein
MLKSTAGAFVSSVVFVHCVFCAHHAQAGSFVPLVTQDAVESFWDDEDNFEEALKGDQTGRFTGQFLNSFASPNSVTVSFDVATNTTIVHFAGPPIARDPATYYTFGFAINAVVPAVPGPKVDPMKKDSYWTPGPLPLPGHIPTVNTAGQYLTATNQAVITLSNDPGTFNLSSVGYLVTNTPFALTDLNRTTLPPGAFIASGIPDGTTLTSGASTSFTISAVNPGQYVTIFSDAQFVSGDSDGSPYKGLSGSWLEFQAVPEPSSWVTLAIGSVALLGRMAVGRRFRRSGFSLTRCPRLEMRKA